MIRTTNASPRAPFISQIRNDNALDCPHGGIVEITGRVASRRLFTGDKPRYSLCTSHAVALAEIAAGAIGPIAQRGQVDLLVLLGDETIAETDRVAPYKDFFYGQKFDLGPWQVEAVVAESGDPTIAHVIATWVGWGSDFEYVRNNTDAVTQNVIGRVWNAAFNVTQLAPGVTYIEYA